MNGIVNTNNTTALIAGGIRTEDFDIISAGQDFESVLKSERLAEF